MQYVGKVGGYVYNQWNSLNPATLSGAIDIIVIEHSDGSLHCSPWHVRFGKFRIIKPSQKKIDLYVNGNKTDLPMKLGDGGEAFFVFETDSTDLSSSLMTSPVISAQSSPEMSPMANGEEGSGNPEALDLNKNKGTEKEKEKERNTELDLERKSELSSAGLAADSAGSEQSGAPQKLTFETVKRITRDLNIPSKIDVNGDVILDMDGYKPNSQKNIDSSDKLVHDIFLKEMRAVLGGNEWLGHQAKDDDSAQMRLLQSIVKKDEDGSIRIVYDDEEYTDAADNTDTISAMPSADLTIPSEQTPVNSVPVVDHNADEPSKTYIKTLRLTSEQLANLNLQYGRNSLVFRSPQGGSQVEADLYLWKSTVPIVISDIDGTITKSDALGHVLTMFGRDWTHPGVANLFQDITRNGYNIMYLTARSVGQADTTRQYLDSILQDGVKLPKGPVILSPDRTMAALRREIILKKPEVFKMACLRDINSLFFSPQSEAMAQDLEADERTPFYAGFGNRITDAISYRSVKIPSHRIFTINPNGEVHMELLELAGYRSSYLHIGELVDQFFPPLKHISDFSHGWNQDQLDQYIHSKDSGSADAETKCPGSPRSPMIPGSPRSMHSDEMLIRPDERFTDLNYWREPLINLSDLSDSDDSDKGKNDKKDNSENTDSRSSKSRSSPPSPKPAALSPPVSPRLLSVASNFDQNTTPKQERPVSASFTSPLKNFMIRGGNATAAPKPMSSPLHFGQEHGAGSARSVTDDDIDEDDDYTDDYDDDEEDDDDYEDEDEEDEDEEDEDEEEDEEEEVDDEEDKEDAQLEQEVDDEDLDLDDGLPQKSKSSSPSTESPLEDEAEDYRIMTASDMLKGLDI